ncbi:MAG: hypothetical protein GYB65_00370, partial [Chloroflexi bacterium]|nr:hypothetical protein [Chloroflexota bacterium]
MERSKVYELVRELPPAMQPQYAPAYQQAVEDQGLNDIPHWFLLAIALDYEPDTISAAKMFERGPYAALTVQQVRMADLAERGYFEA